MVHLISTGIIGVATLLLGTMPSDADGGSVSIIIVRHSEVDASRVNQPVIPLSQRGQARAELLAQTLRDLKFTHVFSTHTTRSRDTIAAIAAKQNLAIVQFPEPGSLLYGNRVTDQTPRRAAIEPLSDAVLKLPSGSVVLLSLNSENIYAILNKLGVPAAAPGQSCPSGSMCVPCTDNNCFPREDYDRVWYLVREPSRSKPLAFFQFRYGAGWRGLD